MVTVGKNVEPGIVVAGASSGVLAGWSLFELKNIFRNGFAKKYNMTARPIKSSQDELSKAPKRRFLRLAAKLNLALAATILGVLPRGCLSF